MYALCAYKNIKLFFASYFGSQPDASSGFSPYISFWSKLFAGLRFSSGPCVFASTTRCPCLRCLPWSQPHPWAPKAWAFRASQRTKGGCQVEFVTDFPSGSGEGILSDRKCQVTLCSPEVFMCFPNCFPFGKLSWSCPTEVLTPRIRLSVLSNSVSRREYMRLSEELFIFIFNLFITHFYSFFIFRLSGGILAILIFFLKQPIIFIFAPCRNPSEDHATDWHHA